MDETNTVVHHNVDFDCEILKCGNIGLTIGSDSYILYCEQNRNQYAEQARLDLSHLPTAESLLRILQTSSKIHVILIMQVLLPDTVDPILFYSVVCSQLHEHPVKDTSTKLIKRAVIIGAKYVGDEGSINEGVKASMDLLYTTFVNLSFHTRTKLFLPTSADCDFETFLNTIKVDINIERLVVVVIGHGILQIGDDTNGGLFLLPNGNWIDVRCAMRFRNFIKNSITDPPTMLIMCTCYSAIVNPTSLILSNELPSTLATYTFSRLHPTWLDIAASKWNELSYGNRHGHFLAQAIATTLQPCNKFENNQAFFDALNANYEGQTEIECRYGCFPLYEGASGKFF